MFDFWLNEEIINKMERHEKNPVKIDNGLERFRGKILFPEKVELAKKMLANVKLPEIPEKK